MNTGRKFINDLGWELTKAISIDSAVDIIEQAVEAGRQEIRDAVVMLHRQLPPRIFYETLVQHIATLKSRRYVVAPAGAELGADDVRINWKNPESIIMSFIQSEDGKFKKFTGPVYLKPGWTSDKECRDIVAKLLRDGVEVREV